MIEQNPVVAEITDDGFEQEVLHSPIPVVVDFWAEWCGPCKAMTPLLEDVAQQLAGRVKVVKIDIDDNLAIATRYAVRAIPTLMLFDKGKPYSSHTGLLSRERLRDWIDSVA